MYKVTCEYAGCGYQVIDSDFDKVADAFFIHAQRSHIAPVTGKWENSNAAPKRQKEDTKA